jgi:hypothetical protein
MPENTTTPEFRPPGWNEWAFMGLLALVAALCVVTVITH